MSVRVSPRDGFSTCEFKLPSIDNRYTKCICANFDNDFNVMCGIEMLFYVLRMRIFKKNLWQLFHLTVILI